ncbi:anthranilate phosphoribosyltransferase [Salana multivorans]|uniref:Anthranilate phosphoribosyltransferase n=1 Tax=Salana multivorans TaxID=120377 RepID=A0A3N2D1Q9_9MICO|nr:anthranilate phosphoribosyltransferase [Salana multivorans]MBN8881833.1 anthranilate phosphoribosyltransferase [Salana multivorans]OJX94468.1 MAG: anthranilate phosphoribosyltransferase [Micrococcales bacterium 73-15]ROR93699.1 anthranilate phosphoribosyltransferase [Salana multivorans]
MTTAGAEPTVADLLAQLIEGNDLDADQARWVMGRVMAGELPPAQLAGVLVALAAKGESVAELRGFSDAMIAAAIPLEVPGRTVDIVGTGGDRHRSVNVSTMAALVVAGSGLRVVKHGNRAASSASGAADVLEALGVRLDVPPGRVAELAREVGITFAFAAVFHPAMRHAGPTRSALGVRTIFNVLGPLTNPARPRAGAIGVANAAMAPLMAEVFASRGDDVLLYRSHDGLDEWATTAPTTVWEIGGGSVTEHVVDATEAFGMAPATLEDLRGADAAYNAEVVRRVLAGERGAPRDAVLLGAAAAIAAEGSLVGDGTLVERVGEAIDVAARSIDTGAAADVLERWAAATTTA